MKKIVVLIALLLMLLMLCACTTEPAQLVVIPNAQTTAIPSQPAHTAEPSLIVIMTYVPTVEPTAVPATPTPTPIPSPTPSPTPEPTRDPNRKMVALTFDDGPTDEYTPLILDILEQYGAKATFFTQGNRLKDKGAVLDRMVSLDCQIGCHGWDHTKMTTQTRTQMQNDFTRACDRINSTVTGGYTVTVMRPPYGDTDGSVTSAMKGLGLSIIKWNVDSRDWESRNANSVYDLCTENLQSGQILIFHDKFQSTVDAIERLVPYLIENGYDLVTVTELIESSGTPMEAGKIYRSRP